MGNKNIPMPAIIGVIVVVVAILGFVTYKMFVSQDADPLAGLTQQQKIDKIKKDTAGMMQRENGGGMTKLQGVPLNNGGGK